MNDKKDLEVESTIEEIGTYTVFSAGYHDPVKAAEAKARWDRERAIARQMYEEKLRRAGGRPVVRRSGGMGGGCFWLGALIRETAKFYVYASNSLHADTPVEEWKEERISKENAHLTPCRCCPDHPETIHPS